MTDSDRRHGRHGDSKPHAHRSRSGFTAALATACAVVVITGCSANAGIGSRDVAAGQLRYDMQALAAAAAAHDIPAAQAALATLRRDAAAVHTTRAIDDASLARILASAQTVQADLNAVSLSYTSTPSTSRTTTPVATPKPTPTPPGYGHDGGD